MKNNWIEEFIEKGADLEHDRWAKWQEYMHSKVYDSSESLNPHLKVIPTESYNRWERQIKTKYADLSEQEKESDRIEVRKYLPIIQDLLTKKDKEHKAELEMIKGEIENEIEPPHEHGIDCKHYDDCHNFSNYERWYNKGIKQSISIIDKHINK